jgi:hypothetical protein
VRRVRVLGQADRLMAVEVVVETVAVKDGDGAEWLGATEIKPREGKLGAKWKGSSN